MSLLKKWDSDPPDECQICMVPIHKTFYDCVVPTLPGKLGRWACVCPRCFMLNDCKLGVGFGQEYSKQPDGVWLKTGG